LACTVSGWKQEKVKNGCLGCISIKKYRPATVGAKSLALSKTISRKLCQGWTHFWTAFASKLKLRAFVKYWGLIADNLKKAGWSWGCVSAIDSNGRTIWIADAHRGDGKRLVVHADEKLTGFVELQLAIRAIRSLGRTDPANSPDCAVN
jgi:hypothetical protein